MLKDKLRLILKGLQQTNENEWTTVYKTIEVDVPKDTYNIDWFVVGAEVIEEKQNMIVVSFQGIGKTTLARRDYKWFSVYQTWSLI